MDVQLSEAMAHIIRECRNLMRHDITNVEALLDRSRCQPKRTFREEVARKILESMTWKVGRVLVPHPGETELKFLDAIALEFALCESDKPAHLWAYPPGQLAEQLILTFWDAYTQLDEGAGLDAVAPIENFDIAFPTTPPDRGAELRAHLATVSVTTFGQCTLPPQQRTFFGPESH